MMPKVTICDLMMAYADAERARRFCAGPTDWEKATANRALQAALKKKLLLCA